MGEWPTVDDLKRWVDVEGTENWNADLEAAMETGIARVKSDVGAWDDDLDEPDDALRNAAIRAAIVLRPNTTDATNLETDPSYLGHLKAHRREFGIA